MCTKKTPSPNPLPKGARALSFCLSPLPEGEGWLRALFVKLFSSFAGRRVLGGDQLGQLGLEPQLEIINHFIDHGDQNKGQDG